MLQFQRRAVVGDQRQGGAAGAARRQAIGEAMRRKSLTRDLRPPGDKLDLGKPARVQMVPQKAQRIVRQSLRPAPGPPRRALILRIAL